MPGILEDIADRMQRLEQSVEALAAELHNPEITDLDGIPLADAERIWSAGALDVAEAAKFVGLSRTTLYGLMESGEAPYAMPNGKRLIPRLWLVRYLAKCQENAKQDHASRSA